MRSAGHRSWQLRQPAAQSKLRELHPKGSLRLLCADDEENAKQPGFSVDPQIVRFSTQTCISDIELCRFDAIKEVFRLAGINRVVTVLDPTTRREVRMPISECASSHLARRTFCGNLYKRVKDPNIVASMSGHKEGSKAFARYREIDKDI